MHAIACQDMLRVGIIDDEKFHLPINIDFSNLVERYVSTMLFVQDFKP